MDLLDQTENCWRIAAGYEHEVTAESHLASCVAAELCAICFLNAAAVSGCMSRGVGRVFALAQTPRVSSPTETSNLGAQRTPQAVLWSPGASVVPPMLGQAATAV